jgi:hypothetical protein
MSGIQLTIVNNVVTSASYTSGSRECTIPDTVTAVGLNAFQGVANYLTKVIIPNSVSTIGENSFSYCTNLTSVRLSNILTKIPSVSFYKCNNLRNIDIPNTVTSISTGAFYDCNSLTSIIIPSSVTGIASDAFRNCNNLKSVSLQRTYTQGVTYLAEDSFLAEYLFFESSNISVDSLRQMCYDGYQRSALVRAGFKQSTIDSAYGGISLTIQNNAIIGATNISSISSKIAYIPNHVSSITSTAFNSVSSIITDIIFGNAPTINNIDSSAFINCNKLKSIIIPNTITSINDNTFQGCNNLRNIDIPNTVTLISTGAFQDCTGLTSVSLQRTYAQGLTYLAENSFNNTPNVSKDSLKNLIINGYDVSTLVSAGFNQSTIDDITNSIAKNNRLIIKEPRSLDLSYNNINGVNFTKIDLSYNNINGVNFTKISDNMYYYTTLDMKYNLYDLSNNAYTDEFSKKTIINETDFYAKDNIISYIHHYQFMIIDKSSNYRIRASDFHRNASIDTTSILAYDTFVPSLQFYLFGDSRMHPTTCMIEYFEDQDVPPSARGNNYKITPPSRGGIGGVVIGTFKNQNDLKNDIQLSFTDDNVKVKVNNTDWYFAGNVRYDTGLVNPTTSNTDDVVSIVNPGYNYGVGYYWRIHPTDVPKAPPFLYRTPKLEYVVISSLGIFRQKFKYYNSLNNVEEKLSQHGIEGPGCKGRKLADASNNSVEIGTSPYAAFCARIPYAFINMHPHFYSLNIYKMSTTYDKITIDITENSIILYVPRLSLMGTGINDARPTNEYPAGLVNSVEITFIGTNNVVFMTSVGKDYSGFDLPQSADPYIFDDIIYQPNGETVVSDDDALTALYFNGNNTGKMSKKVLVSSQQTYRISVIREHVKWNKPDFKKWEYRWVIRLHINKI